MKKIVIMIFVMMVFILTGCQTTESVERPSILMTEDGRAVIRSESTVREDSNSDFLLTSQESHQIGTRLTIGIYHDSKVADDVFDELFLLIDDLDQIMSKNITGTEVDLINQNAGISPVIVSEKLFNLIEKSLDYADLSDGLFDITIGAVVNLWDIGTPEAKVPDPETLKDAVSKVGSDRLKLSREDLSVFLEDEGMVLDLGGIAKGLIADEVGRKIIEMGYESAILNFGGDVLAIGSKPENHPWVVGVRDPQNSGLVGTVRAVNISVVSSGVYERFFIEDDIRYHHIINPQTGFPEQNELLSTTLIAQTAADGDALSTAVFLMGVELGLDFVNSLSGVEAIFITKDQKVYVTEGIKHTFSLINDAYTLEP